MKFIMLMTKKVRARDDDAPGDAVTFTHIRESHIGAPYVKS